MRLIVAHPRVLWLLLVIVPAIWIALRVSRTNFNRRQRQLQAVVRATLLTVLVLALAEPVVSRAGAGLSIIYLVDVSHSVAGASITAAAAEIDHLNGNVRPEASRILAFAGDTLPVTDTAGLRALEAPEAPPTQTGSRALRRDDSNLEQALDEARTQRQSGHAPRVVLFSDGRETSGDARDAARRLAASGIPVFPVPLRPRAVGDAWVDAVTLPARVIAGASVPVAVTVTTQRAAHGTLSLRDGTRLLDSRRVSLDPGTVSLRLQAVFDAPGPRMLQASLETDADVISDNNVLMRGVAVERRSRVLYVESQPSSAAYLRAALTDAGFDVDVRGPRAIPTTVADLEPWDVVVLSDVARADITEPSMAALTEWVERRGGGLLVAGGANVFGVGARPNVPGYHDSTLERLMPVTFERNDDPAVALVIVLDKSWSMAGQVIALCKAAAQAAVDVLADDHLAGVITFNDTFKWDVTVRPVGPNRPLIKSAISEIEASGYTVIYPAVEQAYDALRNTRARAKHVVLLSDGKSSPADYEGLVKKMVAAKMTVSTLAVGPGADAELLADVARWGNGRSYVVMDPRQVTQIFVTEARGAATPAIDEGMAITPRVTAPTFLRGVDLSHMPALHGRISTVLKEHALEVLATDANDPLLAFWPIGLGRTAVFASDVKDRWATEWTSWRGYGPFFAAVVHALERSRVSVLDVSPGVTRAGVHSLTVSVDARDAADNYRNLLSPTIRVETAAGRAANVSARQVAPGRYVAAVTADARQPVTVTLLEEDGLPQTSVLVPVDPAAEYRFRPADEALLESLASMTGGTMRPDAAALTRAVAPATATRHALWPSLVLLALALWFVDLVLRRIRLFET